MNFFFEDYGCMRCRTKDAPYGSNALCKACMQEVKLKMFLAIKRRRISGQRVRQHLAKVGQPCWRVYPDDSHWLLH
jgi:hypothetical protein